jgi:hypothetical protein
MTAGRCSHPLRSNRASVRDTQPVPRPRSSNPVARAIANHPALIFADEPTANLDSRRGAETMRLLRRLGKEEGATVLIVSHDERLARSQIACPGSRMDSSRSSPARIGGVEAAGGGGGPQ